MGISWEFMGISWEFHGNSWGFHGISGFLDRDFTKKNMGILIHLPSGNHSWTINPPVG
jgi:hypothetical protein